MYACATCLLSLFLTVYLTFSPLATAQDSANPTLAGGGASSSSSSQKGSRSPLSDYVPCLFSEDEQWDMRSRVAVSRPLDLRSAQQLLDLTMIELSQVLGQYSQQNSDFVAAVYKEYKSRLRAGDIAGMTYDQASTHIQSVLADAVAAATTATQQTAQQNNKRLLSDMDLEKKKEQAAFRVQNIAGSAASEFINDPKNNVKKGQTITGETADKLIDVVKNAIAKPDPSGRLSPEYLKAIRDSFQPDKSILSRADNNAADYLAYVARQIALNVEPYPYSETAAADTTKTQASLTIDLGESADKAAKKAAAKQFQAPEDVSCSMAVMSWKETRDIFGRRVANTFVAIQVTLRNLNSKNEFLVHDIQVAVDTGISADEFGRFQAGRDKLLVRAVAQRGQSADRRNLALNALQAIGAMAGAASITAGTVEFKDAVAVFQGSFISGFSNIFPDHTVEQLNHINDLVFSASNTSKVLVPVQGSVPLVTFISTKPLEQLPFAWCGHPPSGRMKRWLLHSNPEQNCDFNGDASMRGYGDPHTPGYLTGYHSKDGKLKHGSDYEDENGDPRKLGTQGTGDNKVEDVEPWDNLDYRHWRAAALRMLQERTFVVVGGIHIQEVVTQPKIANLSCPTLTGGQIDISQTKDGTVNCSVTGSGLGLASAVDLEKGDTKIAGQIKAAGDGNSATLQFKPDDLYNAEGVYSLFVSYKAGSQTEPKELDSGTIVSLSKQPIIESADMPTISSPLTLKGKNLDQVTEVSLVAEDDSSTKKGAPGATQSPTEASFTFSDPPTAKTYDLNYVIKNHTKPIKSKSVTPKSK